MSTKNTGAAARVRRHIRVRKKVAGTAERPRLCVFRSLNHMYAQVVDDAKGQTLAAAGTVEPEMRKVDGKSKTEMAKLVGKAIAERALGKKIQQVVFDRGGNRYHGRIKALADAAREAGLKF